jgi:hypothetical protein
MTGIKPILIQGLAKGIDLRLCGFDFRLADLAEILGPNVTRQQTDDDHHDQQFEQGKAAAASLTKSHAAGCTLHHRRAPRKARAGIDRGRI